MLALRMFPPEVLKKLKRLEIKAGRLVDLLTAGSYLSTRLGLGMEFDEVRAYQPGDNVRQIDWNVTARMDAPYVKTFREEKEQLIVVALDTSASMLSLIHI